MVSERKELTCIGCPIGCSLFVDIKDIDKIEVSGNLCEKGRIYGEKECINPTRIVTSSVLVDSGEVDVVSVKTENDIPKNKIFEIMAALKGVTVKAPVKIGDIIVENIVNTGVNVVATKNVQAK